MSFLVTKPAPDFSAQAVFPDGSIRELSLSDYKGKYVVLFFYPLDFTFVCPSEIIAFSKKVEDFESKNVDSLFTDANGDGAYDLDDGDRASQRGDGLCYVQYWDPHAPYLRRGKGRKLKRTTSLCMAC